MKWALLSDIHANLQAMDACMAHAHAQGVQRFALLGDLVGYGANPGAVVDKAMALAEQGRGTSGIEPNRGRCIGRLDP